MPPLSQLELENTSWCSSQREAEALRCRSFCAPAALDKQPHATGKLYRNSRSRTRS